MIKAGDAAQWWSSQRGPVLPFWGAAGANKPWMSLNPWKQKPEPKCLGKMLAQLCAPEEKCLVNVGGSGLLPSSKNLFLFVFVVGLLFFSLRQGLIEPRLP